MASNECASYDSIIFLVRGKVQTVNDECWSYFDAKYLKRFKIYIYCQTNFEG